MSILLILCVAAQSTLERGNEAYRQGRYAEAASLYEQALKKKESPLGWLNLGNARLKLEEWAKAIEAYRKSGSDKALRWMARCFLKLGHLDLAEHALMEHLVRFPDDDEKHDRELLAEVYVRQGRHDRAARAYEALLAEQPARTSYHRALARERLAAGRPAEAIDSMEAAWRLGAREANLARLLGDLYVQQGMPLEAAAYYRKYLTVAKDVDAEDRFRIGYAYFQSAEYVSARTFLEEAVKADPSHARAFLTLGHISTARSDPEQARKSYEAAIEKDPTLAAAHVALANLLLAQEDWPAAAAAFAEAVGLGESSLPIHYNRVVSLTRAGRGKEAVGALKEGLRAHPSDKRLLGLLEQIASKD